MRFLTRVCLFFAAVLYCSFAKADVVWNHPVDRNSVINGTDSLFGLVSSSARPGGLREVTINGQEMSVLRLVKPGGDRGEFHKLWQNVKQRRENGLDVGRLPDILTPTAAERLLSPTVPMQNIGDNSEFIVETLAKEVERITSATRALVVEQLESVMAYETLTWRALAKVPVSAIDPSSSLATVGSEHGFIVVGQKQPENDRSDSFWIFRFGENFNILDAMGGNTGRSEEKGNGVEPPVEFFPGSKQTLAFSEKTKGWRSHLWSLESKGDVTSHASYYRDTFIADGYELTHVRDIDINHALLQFRKSGVESTVFIDLVDPASLDVQVSLQMRYGAQ